MISFKSFVNALHDAILSANDRLMDQNEGLLDRYFEEDTASDADVADVRNQSPAERAAKTNYKARSVTLEYPEQTADGVKNVEVQVPLITLVPLSMSQVEEVKFTAEFEMLIVEDELKLIFGTTPPPKGAPQENKKSGRGIFRRKPKEPTRPKGTFGTVEITLAPSETPDGLKHVVDGYEKALRAQIPH